MEENQEYVLETCKNEIKKKSALGKSQYWTSLRKTEKKKDKKPQGKSYLPESSSADQDWATHVDSGNVLNWTDIS